MAVIDAVLLRGNSLRRSFILALILLSAQSYIYKSVLQTNRIRSQHRYASETDQAEVDTFRNLGAGEIPQWLLERCEKLGYVNPTPVQEAALPAVFQGRDVILQAQTGSGKTLVYSIPVLSKIDAKRAAIQAVIVVPSRELGLQVAGILKQLANGSPDKIMIMSLMEGSKNRRQQLWATAEPPHIVVGNPRSIQKIVDVGRLRLNSVAFVVVDEVDACLISSETRQELHTLLSRRLSNSYGTAEDPDDPGLVGMKENRVYSNLAKDQRDIAAANARYRISRQTILCSATIPQRQHFAAMCEKEGWTETIPTLIHVTPKELVPKQVRHEYVDVPENQRLACLKFILKKEIASWNGGVSDDEEKNENNDENNNENRENKIENKDEEKIITRKKSFPKLKKLLSRKEKPEKSVEVEKVVETVVEAKEEEESVTSLAVSSSLTPSSTSTSTSSSPSYPSHFSPFPSAALTLSSTQPLFRPFQAVIFADDEVLAVSVCDTVRSLLAMKGDPSIEALGGVSFLSDLGSLDDRAKALSAFREGTSSVLVCSHIAARGLDVPNITHVVQMKLPDNVDEYLHKAGRTGRLGRKGKAITFTSTEENFVVQRFSNELGVPIHKRAIKSVKKAE